MNFNLVLVIENIQSGFVVIAIYTNAKAIPDSFFQNKKNLWLLEPSYSFDVPQSKVPVVCLNQGHRKEPSHPARYFREIPDEDSIDVFIA